MASSNERLFNGALTALAVVYTVPALKKATVTGMTLTNTGAAQRLVTVKLDDTALLSSYPLDPKETLAFTIGHVLYTTEELKAGQDAGTDVDLVVSGVVEDAP